MSTLPRKPPQYKDYTTFVDSYRNAKKDQIHLANSDSGVSLSLNRSRNNSSSSVLSDTSDVSRASNFKEHFNNFQSRTTNNLPPKGKETKTIKTEMFIEIKNDTPPQYGTQVFEVREIPMDAEQPSKVSVSGTARIFEKNKDQIDSRKPPEKGMKKIAIGEISKKFDSNSNKAPFKRAASIGEISKMFENKQPSNSFLHKNSQKNFNAVPKPFKPSETKLTPSKPAISPKPSLSTAPVFPKFIPDPPRSYADSVDSALSSLSMSPSPPQCVSPPPELCDFPPPPPPEMCILPPPPPPPLPPQGLSAKPVVKRSPIQTTIKVQTDSDGPIEKNDPRVKKAVYGALRNMYGAYHDQANDYLATLPKNRVKKNNGLDSIIDSIASQGGIEKLSGRTIPKQDTE